MSPPCTVTSFGTLGAAIKRSQPLRDQPMNLDDVRLDLTDLAADRQHLGQEQREDLGPATLPAAQILENRPVSEILPAPGKVAETANLQGCHPPLGGRHPEPRGPRP